MEPISEASDIYDAREARPQAPLASMPQQFFAPQPSAQHSHSDPYQLAAYRTIPPNRSQSAAMFPARQTVADRPHLPLRIAPPHDGNSAAAASPSRYQWPTPLAALSYRQLRPLDYEGVLDSIQPPTSDPPASRRDSPTVATTASGRLAAPSRQLLHALAGMTATKPSGNDIQGLTGGQVVEAIMAGRAGPSRSTPLDERYAHTADCMGHELKRLSARAVSNSQLVSGTLTYPVDVGDGWSINALVPSNIHEPPFVRKRGCGQFCPPEGLLYAASKQGMKINTFGLEGPFSPIHSQAAPGQVNITLLRSTPITACELVTWFPTHYVAWEDWNKRLAGNGWSGTNVSRLANKTRNTDKIQGLTKTVIENQSRKIVPAGNRPKVAIYTVNNWNIPTDLDLIDYCLRHLATGVARSEFPSGLDRGPLTEAIEYALDHEEHKYLRLSNVEQLTRDNGFDTTSPFVTTSLGLNPDEQEIRRLKPELERYRILCVERRAAARKE